jgi:tetratricopeptide (TPR) repeat protein
MEKGHAFLAAGNLVKARLEFQNALQIAPTDPEARFENGVVAEKLGKSREAGQFYQGAIDIDPDYVPARAKLGRLMLFSGAPDRALDVIEPSIGKHPDDAGLLTVRAAAKLQKKDPQGAREDAEHAVRASPTNEDAVAVLSGLYAAKLENDRARGLLVHSIELIPGSVDLRLILAQIYVNENDNVHAEGVLNELINLKPEEKSHRIRLAQFYLRNKQPDPGEATLRKAIIDMPSEDDLKVALIDYLSAAHGTETAETELKAMIAANQKDTQLKFALARFYEADKHEDKAEAVYLELIKSEKLDAAGVGARDHLAALRLQRNDVPGALQLIGEVLTNSPRDDEALVLRGEISLSRQDPRSAIMDLRAVLRDQPNSVGVIRSLARAHLANGEPAVAEETMRHALDANPKNPVLQLDFAQLLSQLGKHEQAKPVIAAVLKEEPDSLEALDAQYRNAIALSDVATARSAADAVVALRPKQGLGYMFQGMLAESEKHSDEALKLYAEAGDLQPEAPEPLQATVRLLANSKRIPEAIKRLDEAAAKRPGDSYALKLKGDLLLQTGRAAEAEESYKLAIARAPKMWGPYGGLASAQAAGLEGPDAAIATLRNAKSVVDQTEELSVQLATLLEIRGHHDEAMSEYEDDLRRHPQADVPANNLAMLLANYRTDAASLDRAKELSARFANSTNPSFLDTYGWVLVKRGDAAESVPVLTRVAAKAPDAVIVRYHLGIAQSLTGDDAGARENLTRAVNSGARFSGLDEARATLEKLGKSPLVAAPAPKT